jgi:hypothetical protein
VRSRVLIGAAAWLLGAVAATAGSLLAVEQLGEGILQQQSGELSVTAVNARLAAEKASAVTPSPRATGSGSPAPKSSPSARPAKHSAPPRPPVTGRILSSAGGTAFARCGAGGAFLVYWTPQNGFAAEHVVQGPAPVARITFRGSSSAVIMKVSCRAGLPVAHLTPLQWGGDDGRHDN